MLISLMRMFSEGVLAAEMAFFDILLGIVPGSAGVRHEYCEHKSGTESTYEQTEHTGYTENDSGDHGDEDGDDGRAEHLMLGSLGGDFYTTSVIWSTCTFEDSSNLTELPTNFLNHLLGCTSYGLHCHTAEKECCHCSNECSYQYLWIHQVYLEVVHEVWDSCICS